MTACAYCGRDGRWQHHHLTGRDDQNSYLDPSLTAPACHDDHTLSGDDWHTFRLMTVDRTLTLVERVELRLRRLGCEFARMDLAQGGGTLWGRLADGCVRWANELGRFVECLDDRWPDWRTVGGFYPDGLAPSSITGG